MLKGKPSGENDIVTMQSIKSILSDYEDSFDTTAARPAAQPKPAADDQMLTLQPVRDIETKVNAARFTSVPSGAELAPAPTDAAPKAARVDVADRAHAAAPVKARRATVSMPKINMPKLRMPKLGLSRYMRHVTPRALAILLMLGLAMFNPGVLIFGLLGILLFVIGSFVIFGSDRVWGAVSRALTRYERRAPKRAAHLLDRLDAFAVHWDGFLDRFPEGSVDGLYLPDFANYESEMDQISAKTNDRLDRMHSQV